MRALYVATDLRDADVLQQEVRRAAPKLTFDVCSGTAEARSRTEGMLGYDVMILDSSLPEQEQQQLIEHVRSRQIPLPIVILVGQGANPSSAIVAAADECITRGPRLAERLAPGLRMAIERYRVVATVSRENERLKRSEARLRLIIEAMPAGVVLVDQAGKIQAMNLAGAALVGTSGPSDVVGRELYSLADHDGIQPLRDLVSRAFDGERGKVGFTCHGPDGLLRPLQIEALCIQKDAQGQGSVLGVLSAATGDIVALPPTMEHAEESSVDFAFANDQHSEERIALEQALEEMRAEAARLSHEAESERARVQQVLEELERSRATAAEHHAQKNQIEERHRAAEGRIAELDARIAEIDARGREAEGTASALTARVQQLTGEAAGLRSERDTRQGERQKLQGELDKLHKEIETLRGDLAAQARGQAEAMVRAEAAEQERARVADAAAGTQAGAEAKVKELAGELKSAQARADAHEKALKAEIEKIRADAVRVAEALDAQGKERKGAEAALAAARDALQARVQELEGQVADLESRRQAAVARTAELEEARRAEQAALAGANKHEADLEQQLKAARDEAGRAASERDGLRTELAHVHESHRAAEDDATMKASEAARARADLEGRVRQLQAELDRVQGERQAAQGALDATVAQADGARGELDQLRADLDQRRAELEQRSAALQQRDQELHQRDAELGQARGELAEVRGELERVRGEFDQARVEIETARGAHAREVEDVKAAVAKAATVIDELRQGRDAIDARAHAATDELGTLRREAEASRQQAADLQQTLERERADARERLASAERDHQDAMTRLHKQVEEAREFQAAAANRAPAERGRRRPGERLGQLASAMANDLHGIVNGMTDEARKLLAELPEGSSVRAQAEQSLQSANRAGQLVRHLLRLSEREARAMTGSDPNTLVRANEPMLRQLAGPDIDLRFELAPSLPPVECDADELAGLLSTLVVTVRGALPLGGSIRLSTHPPRKDGGRRRNDTSLALSVVAEGYGMVSVPTTVCDEVVTRSGGTFSAQVDLKAGTTTFTAFLPIDQTAEGVTNIA